MTSGNCEHVISNGFHVAQQVQHGAQSAPATDLKNKIISQTCNDADTEGERRFPGSGKDSILLQ